MRVERQEEERGVFFVRGDLDRVRLAWLTGKPLDLLLRRAPFLQLVGEGAGVSSTAVAGPEAGDAPEFFSRISGSA